MAQRYQLAWGGNQITQRKPLSQGDCTAYGTAEARRKKWVQTTDPSTLPLCTLSPPRIEPRLFCGTEQSRSLPETMLNIWMRKGLLHYDTVSLCRRCRRRRGGALKTLRDLLWPPTRHRPHTSLNKLTTSESGLSEAEFVIERLEYKKKSYIHPHQAPGTLWPWSVVLLCLLHEVCPLYSFYTLNKPADIFTGSSLLYSRTFVNRLSFLLVFCIPNVHVF